MQHSSKPFSRFLAIPLLAGIAVVGVAGSQPAPPDPVDPELREIIERALERAAWAEEEGFETRYRREMTQRVQRFDADGEVTDDETLLYQVERYQGALFSRLMGQTSAINTPTIHFRIRTSVPISPNSSAAARAASG